MRVILIAPPYPLEEAPSPSLGISYVASAFENAGAEVRVIDYIVSQYTPAKLKRSLDEFQPDIIGSTAVTMNFLAAADIITTAKKLAPHAITMMGGPHVSFDAVNTMNTYRDIDMIVTGEGETTIQEIVACIHGDKKWSEIKGIVYRKNGSIEVMEPRGFIEDLNTLPFPARHLLPLSRYRALGFPVTMITGRGCPYSCIFCLGRRMVGGKPRQRKASLVVDEMEHILSYGFSRINIADDLFTSNKQKVQDVCEEIKKRHLKFEWTVFARVNTVDRDSLRLMKDAGCDCISFGIESGNQDMLKRVKKGITLEKAETAVRLCKETAITPHASFMVGLPGESPETLRDTATFARSLDILYGYHYLAPFPGTTVREQIEKYDLQILTDNWSHYDANRAIVRTSALSPEDMTAFVGEYEKEFFQDWEKMVQGYKSGTNSIEDDLRVAGHYRMQLVYKILSEDLVEKCGIFKKENGKSEEETVDEFCLRLEKSTGADLMLIQNTIRSFIDAGYIKCDKQKERFIWFWTHNNQVGRFVS